MKGKLVDHLKRVLKDNKGNALLTAIIAFCVLIIIAVSVAGLSLSGAILSVQTKQYGNTYYTAETAVQKGIQHIKDTTGKYYREMQDTALSSGYDAYLTKYDGFYSAIINNAKNSFIEPDFTASGTASTSTDFSFENFDASANTADMVVDSTAALLDGTSRTVRGVVKVKRQPVMIQTGSTYNPSENVLTVGRNVVFYNNTNTQQLTVSGGAAEIGGFVNKNSYKKLLPEDQVSIIPGLGDAIPNDLTYAALLAKRSTAVTRYITATTPPTWSDQGSPTDLRYLEGVEGLSFTVTQGTYYGQVYCRGQDLYFQGGNYYGNVFCDGNVSLNCVYFNGNIVAAGNINISGGTYSGTISDGKLTRGAFFAGGNINLNSGGTLQNAFVYAKHDFNMNSNPSGAAVIFAGNDINLTMTNTFSYSGTMTAKNDFIFHAPDRFYHQLNNAPTLAAAAREHDWYSTFFNTVSYTMQDIDVNEIVKKEQIYEN